MKKNYKKGNCNDDPRKVVGRVMSFYLKLRFFNDRGLLYVTNIHYILVDYVRNISFVLRNPMFVMSCSPWSGSARWLCCPWWGLMPLMTIICLLMIVIFVMLVTAVMTHVYDDSNVCDVHDGLDDWDARRSLVSNLNLHCRSFDAVMLLKRWSQEIF
jgi:uncharacterized membrane protein